MPPDHLCELNLVRGYDLDVDRVTLAHAVDDFVGRLGQRAGVEREHAHVASNLRRHVDQDRRLDLEARNDDPPRERRVGPLQNCFRSRARLDFFGRDRAHAVLSATVASRRASKPTRSVHLPKPSPGVRSDRNASNSGRRSDVISVIGTLGANTRLRRVPSKSPPSITSYLPSVVPTKPTSPR